MENIILNMPASPWHLGGDLRVRVQIPALPATFCQKISKKTRK